MPVDAFLSVELKRRAVMTHRPLAEILDGVQCAFVSTMTSAVLEPALQGIPTALMTPGDALSLSPAWGLGFTTIAHASDLSGFLAKPGQNQALPDFFTLGTGMDGWRELLWGTETIHNKEST
jgi:surface carbohydrate biosynthesis protein (TIGR04326 family)